MKKTIQHLQLGVTAAKLPTWVNTSYKTLAEARKANPNELPNFFRIKRAK